MSRKAAGKLCKLPTYSFHNVNTRTPAEGAGPVGDVRLGMSLGRLDCEHSEQQCIPQFYSEKLLRQIPINFFIPVLPVLRDAAGRLLIRHIHPQIHQDRLLLLDGQMGLKAAVGRLIVL